MTDKDEKQQKMNDKDEELTSFVQQLYNTSKRDIIQQLIQYSIENPQIQTKLFKQKNKQQQDFKLNDQPCRKIALEISYVGPEYQGLQYQSDTIQSVENILFTALKHSYMIPKDATPQSIVLERSGRTDSNVSGINQTLSFFIRCTKEESQITFQQLPEYIEQKKLNQIKQSEKTSYNYAVIINKYLPNSIHVISYSTKIPSDFSARYSTINRSYVYFYPKSNFYKMEQFQEILNVFKGQHDFRNFCYKKPEDREENYTKTLNIFDISNYNDQFYQINIQGTGFLYHQIRCMIAAASQVLYGRWEIEEVKKMLDDINYTREYIMAPGELLCFNGCQYDKQIYDKTQNIGVKENTRQNRKCIAYAGELTLGYMMQQQGFVEEKAFINWFEQSMGLKRK